MNVIKETINLVAKAISKKMLNPLNSTEYMHTYNYLLTLAKGKQKAHSHNTRK